MNNPDFKRMLVALSSSWREEDETLIINAADEHAAQQAIWLAAKSGAEVRFIHVIDFIDEEHVGQTVSTQVRDQLGAHIESLRLEAKSCGVDATSLITQGKPWREILDEADQWDADVIVVSPRREAIGTFDRLRYGSTTRRLVRNANSHVWVVDPSGPRAIRRVLALVDRSAVSQAVVDAAGRIAALAGADKAVLHCLDYPDDVVMHRLPHARKAIASYHRAQKESASGYLKSLVGDEADWSVLLSDDWVVRAAPKLVEDDKYDLIVIAGVSSPRIKVLFGMTAERIIDRTNASCWIVRQEETKGQQP
jgi:nucleotide-binding universal stress UspA family protein